MTSDEISIVAGTTATATVTVIGDMAVPPPNHEAVSAQQKFFAVSKRVPQDVKRYCGICRQHGLQMRTRGHVCTFKDCHCDKCQLVLSRRNVMSEQIRLRRAQDRCFQRTSEPSEANIVPINAAQLAASSGVRRTRGDAASGPCYFCQKCKNHGILALKKQHKHECKFSNCMCPQCALIATRRSIDQDIKIPRSQKRSNGSSSPTESLLSAPSVSNDGDEAPAKRPRVSCGSTAGSSSDCSPLSSAPETPAFPPATFLNDGASTFEWALSPPLKTGDFSHFKFDSDASPQSAPALLSGAESMMSTMLENIMVDANENNQEPVKSACSLLSQLPVTPAALPLVSASALFNNRPVQSSGDESVDMRLLTEILTAQQQRQRLIELQKLQLERQREKQLRLLSEQIRQEQNNLELLKHQQLLLASQKFNGQSAAVLPTVSATIPEVNPQHNLQTIIALARQHAMFTAIANASSAPSGDSTLGQISKLF